MSNICLFVDGHSAPSRAFGVGGGFISRLRRPLLLGAAGAVAFCSGSIRAQSVGLQAELPQLKVGDRWKLETRDKYTGAVEGASDLAVVAVSPTRINLTVNASGEAVWTPELTVLDKPSLTYDIGYRWLSFPLEVGKSWDFKTKWKRKDTGSNGVTQMDVVVKGVEKVSVKAGEFDAFRLEAKGYMNVYTNSSLSSSVTVNYWYAPAARHFVKMEWEDRVTKNVTELIEVQLAQ